MQPVHLLRREESCAADSRPKIYNPNSDSELALLMQDMFDEGMRVKEEVATGKRTLPAWDADAILRPMPPNPKVATPGFKAYAQSFLEAARAMEEASRRITSRPTRGWSRPASPAIRRSVLNRS